MSASFIYELIREGSLVLWQDYRSGCCHDHSGSGNSGVINGNCYFEGDGLRFADNTAYVEVAHHSSLDLTNATMVLLKPQQRSLNLTAAVNQGWIGKVAGGAGAAWYSYMAISRTYLYDGTVLRWSGASYNDDERYIALSLATGGATAIGYRDGLSIGNLSGANTLPTNTHNLTIGFVTAATDYDGTIQSVMLINRVLTATEIAQVHDELVNLTWPTKFYSFGKRAQAVFKREADIVAGWNMRPSGGVIPDEIGANDGTIVGCPMYEPGILGDALRFDGVKDYINCGNVGTIKSVAFWVKPETNTEDFLDLDGGTHTVEVAAGTVTATGWAAPTIYVDGIASTTLQAGVWQRIVVSTATGIAANPVHLGFETIYLEGKMGNPEFFSTERTSDWVEKDYLQGAWSVQMCTDWGFQVSAAAEGGVVGQIIGTRSSPFRAGDAVGRFKIETDTIDGRLHKVLTCTTAGKVYIPGHCFFDTTQTEAAFGGFRCWMYKADASVMTWKFIGTDLDAAANGYSVEWAADESVVVSELGVGNIIAGGSASHSVWHQFDVTRRSDGDFDGYIDTTTFGNGNDLTITTSIGLLWDMDVNDKLCIDSIIKYLGVFAP